jgi:hypothetical protein
MEDKIRLGLAGRLAVRLGAGGGIAVSQSAATLQACAAPAYLFTPPLSLTRHLANHTK